MSLKSHSLLSVHTGTRISAACRLLCGTFDLPSLINIHFSSHLSDQNLFVILNLTRFNALYFSNLQHIFGDCEWGQGGAINAVIYFFLFSFFNGSVLGPPQGPGLVLCVLGLSSFLSLCNTERGYVIICISQERHLKFRV